MMEPATFALFLGVSWALMIAPGPDIFYVMTRGMVHGRKAGLLSAAGFVCGILIHTTTAALGLTFIFQMSSMAFLLAKSAGALYLMYLGFKTWKDKNVFRPPTPHASIRPGAIFWQGVLSNVLNPKIAIFFLAFLPQFVDQESSQVALQMMILGITFAVFGLGFLLMVGYFSGTLGRWLMDRPTYTRLFQRVAGGILVSLGIRLALTER